MVSAYRDLVISYQISGFLLFADVNLQTEGEINEWKLLAIITVVRCNMRSFSNPLPSPPSSPPLRAITFLG